MHAPIYLCSAFAFGVAAVPYSYQPGKSELLLARATTWPNQTFRTTNFQPPVLNITKSGKKLAPGLLLFTPAPVDGSGEVAALITTDTGDLVWNSVPGLSYNNLFVQSLNSKPILTMWIGDGSPNVQVIGHGYGRVSILDTTYTEIYSICPHFDLVTPNNYNFTCNADLHESYVTERGSILVTAYNITTADLTSVNGTSKGYIYDSLFYEIDIKTQKILFRWSSLEAGIPLSKSKVPITGSGTLASPWDWFHINSIQSVGRGYLINSRHLWTSYLLDSAGNIQWNITGDTGGDFAPLPAGGNFAWQHHARAQSVTDTGLILHYFNNYNNGQPLNSSKPSDGLKFSLDLITHKATLLKSLVDPNDLIYAGSQGSSSPLKNGNTLIGYGAVAKIKEFGPHGNNDVRMTVEFGDANSQSYRAYREVWHATPAAPPVAIVEAGVVYMSWNGATDVSSWVVYQGQVNGTLVKAGTVKNKGFETRFTLTGKPKFVQVAARSGDVLRKSTVIAA